MKNNEVLNIVQNATKAIEEFFSIPKKVELKFEKAKVKNGEQIVQYTSPEVGATVEISSGEGSEKAPDGKYELENDLSFIVKDGVIEEITSELPKEDVPVDITIEEMEDTPAGVDTPSKEDFDALVERVTALEKALTDLAPKEETPSKEDFTALVGEIKALNKAVGTLAVTPEEFSKIDNSNIAKDEKQAKIEALAAIFHARK